MKRILVIICLLSVLILIPVPKAAAQADEVAQLLLNLEKLKQLREILQQMKQGYEILAGGYNTVINIAQGNFKMHQAFLDGLLAVSPTVRNYKRVGGIIDLQIILVKESKGALNRFLRDSHFTSQELAYFAGIYDNLLKQSLRNLDELTTVVTAGKLRMNDDERLKAIDRIYENMSDMLTFLRNFNSNTTLLAAQRAKERNDVKTIQHIYGIKN